MALTGYQGATTLVYTSLSPFGYFEGTIVSSKEEGTVKFSLWATTEAIKNYPTGDWKKIAECNLPMNLIGINFGIDINSSSFIGARGFAMELATPSRGECYASVSPTYIQYYTQTMSILKQDSSFGYYQWLSIDGGYSA